MTGVLLVLRGGHVRVVLAHRREICRVRVGLIGAGRRRVGVLIGVCSARIVVRSNIVISVVAGGRLKRKKKNSTCIAIGIWLHCGFKERLKIYFWIQGCPQLS